MVKSIEMNALQVQYADKGIVEGFAQDVAGPSVAARHNYETRKKLRFGEQGETKKGETLSSPTDDSDLEWKIGRHYSEEDDDTDEDEGDYVDSDVNLDIGEYYDSDEADEVYINGKIVLRQFLRFSDHRQFAQVMRDYAVQEGFELQKVKQERIRVTFVCRADACPWRIHASLSPDERHPNMSLKGMREELKDTWGIEVNNRRLWRARAIARGEVKGNHVQSYGKLRRYAFMVMQTNPGTDRGTKLMNMMYARKVIAERCKTKLTPAVHLKVNQLLKDASFAEVTRVADYEFQVEYKEKKCGVMLDKGYCICGQWQIRGIPCVHASACINYIRADIYSYCSDYFTTESWKKTYDHVIHPIPDESMWPQFQDELLVPPQVKRPTGRPKKHRRRKVTGEERSLKPISSTKKCKNCHQFGHIAKSCKEEPIQKKKSKETTRNKGKEKQNLESQGRARGRPKGASTSTQGSCAGRVRGRPRSVSTSTQGQGASHLEEYKLTETTKRVRGRPKGMGRDKSIMVSTQTNHDEVNTSQAHPDIFPSQPI
ncbi:hypothetical protein G4B88_018823 [Cannabis sativa]|uniref:SWIM-type domain-containing protein n=1 Tax=Cannabis sativa TaxID=3483 RepID=A0A7J6EC53_CANSA|nr:hypothetical protein G4B88_018823 [Cannabis sativa]